MIKLIKPSIEYFEQIIESKQDFFSNNELRIQGQDH